MKDLVDNESDVNFNVRKLQGTITNYFGNRIQLVKGKKKNQKKYETNKEYTIEESILLKRFSIMNIFN